MKKLAAILLLGILLFNWVGYRLVINYVDYSNDRQLEARLDLGDYEEEDLIELKVHISLPYQVSWRNFERINGQIEIDGIHYQYVKRKFQNDSLVLMCLPNHHKAEIQDAKTRFFALANDLNSSDPNGKTEKKPSSSFKNLISDCLLFSNELECSAYQPKDQLLSASHSSILLSPTVTLPERPPAAA